MSASEWSGDDLVAALLGPVEPPFAGEVAVVTAPPTTATTAADLIRAVDRLATLPCVVVAAPGVAVDPPAHPLSDHPRTCVARAEIPASATHVRGGVEEGAGVAGSAASAALSALVDLAVADHGELADVVAAVEAHPLAASSTAVVLRGSERRSVADGLAVESAVFSALQAGPEHRRWLAERPTRAPRAADDGPRVRVERDGDTLHVTLTRPAAHNAVDVRMRDELLAALAIAEADPDLRVELRGEGRSFCAGGDLDAFGTAPDAATAHLVRLRTSIGAVLHRLADRTTVHVHGACAGSGVELAAFCGRVVARPDTTFVLPELSLGLVPGAGGTVSLARRVGRHRTAWLVLTGRRIDAEVARTWHLVDEICLI